ncbi:MAG: TlpA disulfide reductase family protein [Oscillospiraceae bacterium]|nr:TlpA disulfide reductase family protein [Oscillospiraceae bacterium]
MKSKKTVLILAGTLVVLLVVVSILYKTFGAGSVPSTVPQEQTQAASDGEKEEDKKTAAAPDFGMTDADGSAITFSDITAGGKPVVLNFWTSWCGYCKQEMPDFEAAYEAYGDRVEFVMLNAAASEYTDGAGEAYIQDQGYTFPVYYDTAGEGTSVYGLRGFPTTVVVGADGNIQYAQSGMLSAEKLQTLIDAALA